MCCDHAYIFLNFFQVFPRFPTTPDLPRHNRHSFLLIWTKAQHPNRFLELLQPLLLFELYSLRPNCPFASYVTAPNCQMADFLIFLCYYLVLDFNFCLQIVGLCYQCCGDHHHIDSASLALMAWFEIKICLWSKLQ